MKHCSRTETRYHCCRCHSIVLLLSENVNDQSGLSVDGDNATAAIIYIGPTQQPDALLKEEITNNLSGYELSTDPQTHKNMTITANETTESAS